jgi:hypothetical protein
LNQLQTLPKDRRHPADYRDEIEHAEVAAALSELPEDHPARVAYLDYVDTIALTHLVADRPELVEALKKAYIASCGRLLRSGGHFRP